MSAEQISDRTKIQLFKIVALERDDFARLPQGIYLDGIVRAYAHEAGIDPEPVVDRVRAERGKLPGDWEVPFAGPIDLHPAHAQDDIPPLDEIPVLESSSDEDSLDGFTAESDLNTAPVTRREYQAVVAPRQLDTPLPTEPPRTPEPPPARREYVAPAPDDAAEVPLDTELPLDSDAPPAAYAAHTIPPPHRPSSQRSGALLPILILLAAAGLGMYFYEAARALDRREASSASTAEPASDITHDAATSDMPTAAPEARANAPVPFSENVISPDDGRREARSGRARAVPRDTPGSSDTATPPARQVPTTGSRPETPEKSARSASLPDVTGSWRLATQIESSSYAEYSGLTLGYEMQLEQDGDRITGTGRKISENGSGVRGKAQTPLTVNGTINGDRLTLNFFERGARRPTQGKFVLLLEEDGRLRGRFSSDAARSSGLAEARRVQ